MSKTSKPSSPENQTPDTTASDEPIILEDSLDELWNQYKNLILGGAVVLCLAGVIGAWVWIEHTATYESAMKEYTSSSTPDVWKVVIEKYPGTPFAAQSLLQLANEAAGKTDFIQAADLYRKFQNQFPSHPACPAADYARAACLDYAGEKDKAMNAYRAILATRPEHAMSGQATVGLAKIYMDQKLYANARQVLNEFLAGVPRGSMVNEVRALLAKVDEAAPAPPAEATTEAPQKEASSQADSKEG